jgi:urease beta subunit
VRIPNAGELAASIGSHVPLSALSGCLRCSTTRPARLRLVAGASVRIEPGDEVEVEVTWC